MRVKTDSRQSNLFDILSHVDTASQRKHIKSTSAEYLRAPQRTGRKAKIHNGVELLRICTLIELPYTCLKSSNFIYALHIQMAFPL